MSRPFVIADLHLGHKKLQDIRGVSDDELVERWNSVVNKRDVVYVLGDVFKLVRIPEMKGLKKLVLGNHDQYTVSRYLDYFTRVAAMLSYNNCLLTHIPVHPNQRHRWTRNIHGHLHSGKIDDPFYVNVSAERVNYTPIPLDDAVHGRVE